MPTRVSDVWRKVRLYAPNVPVTLVQTWVQDAYKALTHSRQFGYRVKQTQVVWDDARMGLACGVTRRSTTVTSTALFVAGDAGRQWRVGSFPIYTIQEVVSTSEITLDQPYYGGPTGAVTADILDCYATMPADFGSFTILIDPTNQRFVPWWATQMELGVIDPTRSASDSTPRLLVARQLSQYTPTLGQVTYEYWPKPTAAGALQAYYVTSPGELADDFILQGVLAERSDVLETGALASCAKYPGTADKPNPYFNLNLARQLDADFEKAKIQLDIRDDDIYPQDWDTIPWQRWSGWNWAYDTHLLQMTDATIGDYAGYFGGGY